MQGRAYDEDFFLSFTAKSEISGGGKVFDAIVDSKGNGDYTTLQAAINAITTPPTSPYKIFIANGTYNECVRINKNKPFVHLIGESRGLILFSTKIHQPAKPDIVKTKTQ